MNAITFPGCKPMIAGVEAEQALLGAYAVDLSLLDDRIAADTFGEPVHRRLFAAMIKLRGEAPAPEAVLPVLASRMKDDPAFRGLGGAAYLADLIDRAPAGGQIGPLAREVASNALDRLETALRDDAGDLSPDAADFLFERRRAVEGLRNSVWRVLDPAAWQEGHAPLRQWAWHELILANSATYLTGAGSAGKSLLGQQLCSHVALGRPFLGAETRQGVALYVTCEDDAQELHRRQLSICEALDVEPAMLSGWLHLVSLTTMIGNELATFDQLGRMSTTPSWQRLRKAVQESGATFVVLDNVAHLFAGNENIRNQVAAFCGLMNALAADAGAAVLFIGHPNKAGDAFSGSTAWENQVRSRLFLGRPESEEGEILDPDARVLSRGKANYARLGESISFRWYRGAFVRLEDLRGNVEHMLDATETLRLEEERFLSCLALATSQQRAVSHQNGINWAPRRFAAMPAALGLGEAALSRAMERLFQEGAIVADQPLWRGPDRHWKKGLKASGQVREPPREASCGDPCGNPAGSCGDPASIPCNACGDPAETQVREPPAVTPCGDPLREPAETPSQTLTLPAGTPAVTCGREPPYYK